MSNNPTPTIGLYSSNDANQLYARLRLRRLQVQQLEAQLGGTLRYIKKELKRPQWTAFRAVLDLTDAEVRKFIDAAR